MTNLETIRTTLSQLLNDSTQMDSKTTRALEDVIGLVQDEMLKQGEEI